MSNIEWTEKTWNPTVGCSIVSPGCKNCYAMTMAARIELMNDAARASGKTTVVPQYDGTTHKVNGHQVWTGTINRAPEATLLAPLRRKKPTTYFVNSMSDLFHDDIPDAWIDQVFAVMALTPQHTYQVLTKRAKRMRDYCSSPTVARRVYEIACDMVVEREIQVILIADAAQEAFAPPGPRIFLDRWPLRNVWLGVSTERQQEANERIPLLLDTPAAVRFISAEPLLGPINLHPLWDGTNALTSSTGPNLDWVIVGGESGPDARPMHPDWARALRNQCDAADVRFFFKQWGEWWEVESEARADDGGHVVIEDENPMFDCKTDGYLAPDGRFFRNDASVPVGVKCRWMTRLGKQRAGRVLDGLIHDEYPVVSAERGQPPALFSADGKAAK
jgi:protein gp37